MKRFAIYYASSRDVSLTREAARWLGRDPFTGAVLEPSINGFGRSTWEGIVADPSMYGFHATLKPPFRLAVGAREGDLRERLRTFAASRRPFEARLALGSLAHFVALVLSEPSPEFGSLAADCVREFDAFRAPASADELARRRRGRHNPAHLAYIDRWGYPYVMEEWRFHMTLTSNLPPETFPAVRDHLATLFEPLCHPPLVVDSVCLFQQPEPGAPFLAVERYPFR